MIDWRVVGLAIFLLVSMLGGFLFGVYIGRDSFKVERGIYIDQLKDKENCVDIRGVDGDYSFNIPTS